MRVRLNNVGVIGDCDLEFIPGINLIVGSSGSGKSTLMRSMYNLVSNEFSDSDISFGKNTMHIRVDYNDNFVEYSRSLKAKGERCYYIVNNNQYVKLGRQPLQAVTDVLNIGDIEISGDSVNFNFNLQFSSPFLILGSQSTLYKVLTYRSTFDISSINDLYSVDVKSNSNEISSTFKLKEQFEENLDLLSKQAESLSPIENLYSDYTSYKHRTNTRDEFTSLLSMHKNTELLNSTIMKISNIESHINYAIELSVKLNNLLEFNKVQASYNDINNKIELFSMLISRLDKAAYNTELIIELRKLTNYMTAFKSLSFNLGIIEAALRSEVKFDVYTIGDISRLAELFNSYNKCSKVIDLLSNDNDGYVCTIDSLMLLQSKLKDSYYICNKLLEINKLDECNRKELNEFKVCPLCGNSICEGCNE